MDMSGNIVDFFDSPGSFDGGMFYQTSFVQSSSEPRALAFDGTYLWNLDGEKLYRIRINWFVYLVCIDIYY